MAIFGKAAAMHPLIIMAWCALILVDGFLIYHAVRHFLHYKMARNWPRIEVPADSVEIQRVVYSREGVPTSQQHYEAVLNYRYQVDGQEYTRQAVRSVSDRAEAESLKDHSTFAFIYNPANPAETLENPPGILPFALTLAGLLVINASGMGLITSLASFFAIEGG